ncbi:MAG: HNH endonuclease [Planctomycetes bacterium]|nr:HNH endonuclease [Planctomycetota bacterium]MBU1517911.1 HNH endonuclease [Planctomycetota bacterium]MBU2457386.1 HNH endonuclease [Planctomycetota bacterium]MBU2596235.1 HNH endonuclease [Planctomycetota bacterium]
MSKLTIQIPYPTFIENLFVFFLLRYRKKHYGFAFRRIKLLTNGPEQRYTMVDAEDYPKLSKYNWLLARNRGNKCYAVCYEGKLILHMHRMIMNAPKGKVVDHKDRNGLNNTKSNLRLATYSQNCCNRIISRPKSSKYRGVIYIKKTNKYRAGIAIKGEKIHLGCFENEEAAGRAYDKAAKELHGEFAVLNFPEQNCIRV